MIKPVLKIFFLFILSVNATTDLQAAEKSNFDKRLDKKRSSSKLPKEIKAKFNKAIEDLRKKGIEQNSLKKGVKIPDFSINKTPISEIYKKNTIVLKFFRGAWCPYCIFELKEYQKRIEQFQRAKVKVIALTPDQETEIKKMIRKHNLSFEVYQDKDNMIAKKFGIAFKLDEEVNKIYKKFGISLERSQNNKENELPMPGTYVVNKQGIITFAYADADYTKRVDPLVVLKHVLK